MFALTLSKTHGKIEANRQATSGEGIEVLTDLATVLDYNNIIVFM